MSVKKLKDFPQPYHELWALHRIFCALGFSSEDLYVSLDSEINLGPNILCLRLRTQGKEFTASVAKMSADASEKEVLEAWSAFATLVCDTELCTMEDLQESWRNIRWFPDYYQISFFLAVTLVKRGFEIPLLPGSATLTEYATTHGEMFKGLVEGGQG